jgi:TetR/AcrR family transcriptional regulator
MAVTHPRSPRTARPRRTPAATRSRGRATAGRLRPRGGPQPSAPGDAGSRERLLAAAAAEFAARGFAGANVDRIARVARVNKAMIYYHFSSKAALYREIVGEMFRAVGARIREVAASNASPEDKVARFIETIATEAEARPHFPPIWFREIAEGGMHLDEKTLRAIVAIVQALVTILESGVKAGRFRRVHPIVVHAGIIAPIMLFFGSAGLRARLERAGIGSVAQVTRDVMVAHVQSVTLSVLKGTVA